MALNHVSIMGRLTKDVELRYTRTQKPVASFTIAVDRDHSGQGGERETDFFDIVAWNNTAEFVNKYFNKGSMIVVAGRLQTRTYTDRDGNNRKVTEIIASNVYFGESKRNESAKPEQPRYQSQNSYKPSGRSYGNGAFAELDEDDVDCPF